METKSNFAHPSLRLLALILDLFVMVILCLGFLVLLTQLSEVADVLPSLILFISQSIFAFLVYSFVCVYMIALTGQTPGKFLTGIKIIKEDGSLLTFKEALYRELIAKMLSNGFFFLGYFWAYRDSSRQTWHDQAANTFVVKTHSYGIFSGLLSFVLLVCLGGYFGYQIWNNIQESKGVLEEIMTIVKSENER